MNKKIILFFILFYSILFALPIRAEQPRISVSGGWFLSISELDLVSGPGSDLKSTYLSPPDATLIDIKAEPKTLWSIYAKRTAAATDGIGISVKRTSDGKGKGWVEGGEYFIPLGDGYTKLFHGKGERIDITLQYRITGISINTPPGMKNIHINFIIEEENP